MKAWNIALLIGLSLHSACKTEGTEAESASGLKAGGEDEGGRPAQLYRFDPWMDTLRQTIETPDATPDSIADQIVAGPSRISAFNLQGLCRIYGDEDKMFGKMRDDFKDIEDVIGQWDKYNNVLGKAEEKGKSPEVIAKLEEKLADAREGIKALLVERNWVRDDQGETRLAKIQRHLDEYGWKKYRKDRETVLTYLIDALKSIKETKYNLKHLEEGDGLHELRRDLRWVSIEMRILNGLIGFEKDTQNCPLDAYADLVNQKVAESKYSQLPPSETEPDVCKIPQCLYLGMAEMIEEFGEIKDDAETDVNTSGDEDVSDKVPKKFREKAEKLYSKMTDNRLIDELKDELKKCIN